IAVERTLIDLSIAEADFIIDACELDPSEACIGAPGTRRLLHFSVETPNLGDGDLVLGRPADDDERFAYSMCHAHYHFLSYATYRLVDADDQVVASGRKQAFCLLDTRRLLDEEGVGIAPRYTCEYQGLQRGWSDVYET